MPRTNRKYTQFLGVWLSPQEENNVLKLVSKTGTNKAIVVRRALRELFEEYDLPNDDWTTE